MKTSVAVLLLLSAITFAACEEDAPPAAPPPLPSSVQDLTDGSTKTWKLDYVVQSNDTTLVDAANCRTDERLKFTYTGYQFNLRRGPALCDTTELDTLGGIWGYTNGGQFLELRDTAQELVVTYAVVERTLNVLRLSLPGGVLEAWVPVE